MTPKKSLLIALFITIAIVFGLFYFGAAAISNTGSPLTSGQVLTLCLGALAWLGLFFTSNASMTNTTSTNRLADASQPDSTNFAASYADLLSTMQTELGEQISATEAELKQVKSLMDGAIDDLVDSFISLESTTRIGQNLVKQMASSETDSNDDLNPFKDRQIKSAQLMHDTSTILKKLIQDGKQNQAACASLAESNKNIDPASSKILVGLLLSSDLLHKETKAVANKVATVIEENKATMSMVADEISTTTKQIESDVQLAVKSLQFQDMTTQLIVQCGERLNVMQEMLNAIDLFSQKSAPGDSVYVLQTKLTMARDELKHAGHKRMKQFNVDAGSVELFD